MALIMRLGSALSFATLLMLVKYAGQQGISLPEVMFWRQAVCVPLILVWLTATGNLHQLRTQRLGSHAGRAGLGMTNMIFNFGSTMLLPLAISSTLAFTSPLFAVLLAAVVFREKVGKWRWSAVALGFAGVVIIAQPGGEPISALGAGMALLCAFLIAIINYQIRDLGRTEPAISTVFWFSLFGTLLTLPVLPFFMAHHNLTQWLLVISLGIFGLAGQLFMTASLRIGAVSSVIIMDYSSLIWATLYGWLIWDHFPSRATFMGAPLIVAAGLIIAWRSHKLSLEAASAHGDA